MTEQTLTPSIGTSALADRPDALGSGAALGVRERLRVDGKFFARGGQRVRIQGVTYGPFALNARQEPFPIPERSADDFAGMQAIGVNAIRTYHVPPDWFLSLADEQGIQVFVDVPWPKHLCFLEDQDVQREARRLVQEAARRGRHHPSVLAYSIGNEIPPNIVRWYGPRRVERFLSELSDVAKQADPDGLCTYASYPSTEYLDLAALDFVTFNVYLHDLDTFRRYLMRLQNLVGDKPLLLGELGMDTLRHGEMEQAHYLKGHVAEATLIGLAGSFVFSWTDEWFTGGFPIQNWAFGITHADRSPKASYHALREVYESRTSELLLEPPRISVVVCTCNGSRTLDQCLRSLRMLDYPDFEVIVVDDGSTDDTPAILDRFPEFRVIRQPNNGLSAARNAGLRATKGSIIAYTDDDCFADPDWLTHLAHQFQHSDAAAVGGPNLTPDDGWLAACVAAAPGQPTHVLESDQVAEHIPGCNMAFRREALGAINGFDPQYRKAGDDVDVCWRLQQAGYWITFAPGAFVWHHRRQGPRAYLRQQAGYGEAEALLRFKHPDRFNGRGDGKWRGVLYGASLQGLRLDDAIIYRGIFGTGLFQCLYQPAPAHWAMLPSTLEWHLLVCVVAVISLIWPWAWLGVAAMLGLSLTVAVLQAVQARLDPRHQGFASRLVVTALSYMQPLIRSWSRYHTRLFSYRPPIADPAFPEDCRKHLPLSGTRTNLYWSEEGAGRTTLLASVIAYLNEHGWGKTIDSGWQDWDIEVYCHPWTVLQICTAEEDHGDSKRLIRVRYRMRLRGVTKALGGLALLLGGIAGFFQTWSLVAAASAVLLGCVGTWARGTYRAAEAVTVLDGLARRMNLHSCEQRGGFHDSSPPPPMLPKDDLVKFFPKVLRYLRPHWKLATVSVALILLGALFGLLLPWPLKFLVDNVLQGEPLPEFFAQWLGADRQTHLIIAVVAGLVFTFVQSGLTVLDNYVNTKIDQNMILKFRSDLFRHAQRLSLAFHDQRRSGMLIYAINFQADAAARLVMAIPQLAQSVLTLLGMFWITFLIDPTLALLSLIVAPLLYYSVHFYVKHIQNRLETVRGMEGESLSIIHEAMSMLRVIVAFGREDHEHERFRTQGEQTINARIKVTIWQTLFSLAVNTITAIGTALVLGYGAFQVLQGHISVGQLLVVMAYIALIYKPLETISHTVGSLQEVFIALRMAFDLLDIDPEIKDAPDAIALPRAVGRVTFDNVHFHYRTRVDTLKDISFVAQPGQVVAIVGPTGAGKTTLVSLLPRFYDRQKGRILLDGHDISKLTLESLRAQISVVLQEPLLFSGSIVDNIRYGRLEASMDEIMEAARSANAHDFIIKLPKQYQTELGERGVQLSGGERQRIAVARAFLKDAPFLILDEPTSSIDSKTEAVILDALDRLMVGRTTFMIAHRLSTIRRADHILVLNHGRLVEQGTHDDLLRRDGLYKQLHDIQTRRPSPPWSWPGPPDEEALIAGNPEEDRL